MNISSHARLLARIAGAGLALGLALIPRIWPGAVARHAAERLVRPDARALPGRQRGVRRALAGEDRPGVTIQQSHGGSGKQARAVIDGLEADVVTLALAYDIDAIAGKAGCSRPTGRRGCRTTARRTRRRSCSWCARAIRRASRTGTTSSEPGVAVITPNPKTSGGARWNYLAAWGYALQAAGGSDAKAQRVRRQRCIERAGARLRRARLDDDVRRSAASATCCSPGRTRRCSRSRSSGRTSSRSSCPSLEHPRRAARRGRRQERRQAAAPRAVAKAYLEFLYTPEGQEIVAKHLLPPDATRRSRRKYRAQFPKRRAVHHRRRVRRLGDSAQKTHFADGGMFDQIYRPGAK